MAGPPGDHDHDPKGSCCDCGASPAPPPGEVREGDRVRVDGAHATASWVGKLPDKGEQIWVGVDFDDVKRGKHDGSRDGVRYFAATTKTSGSFVKVDKLDRGVSLSAALDGRFDGAGDEEMPFKESKRGNEQDMKFVGFDKVVEHQSHLDLLKQVKLLDAGVSWCGDVGSCPNLEALLLEQCLLSSWAPVAEMLQRLPSLKTLSLADTRVGHVLTPAGGPYALEVLVLDGCGVTWDDVKTLQASFPKLDSLLLRRNKLGLPPADLVWKGVTNLVLDDNDIKSWDVLAAVAASFPDLTALQLNDNALADNLPEKLVAPAGLLNLSLGNNLIGTYEAIGCICGSAMGKQLTGIRVAENPLSIDVNFRQLVVALMPQLLEYNGSAVRERDRVNGERTLLSLDVQGKAEANKVDPDGSHRARLRVIHGDGIAGSEEVGNLSNSLVQIEFVPMAAAIANKPPVKKKVPTFLDVSEFKVLAHKLFKVPLEHLRLVFHEEGSVVATALEGGDLRTYGMADGAQVMVQDVREDFESKAESKAESAPPVAGAYPGGPKA